LYLVLVILGLAAIYGAVYNFEDTALWDFSKRYGKQLVWIGLSFVIATVLLMLDSRIYSSFAYFIYGASVFLLIVTVVFAPEIKGSRSWLVLGPVNIQPAEFAKAATCLAVAKFMSSYGFKMTNIKDILRLCAIIFLPVALIFLQDEAGLATVYFVLLLVLYREGMPGIILFLVFCVVVFCIVAIKFGDVAIIPAYPNEAFGLLLVMIMSMAVQLVFLQVYPKDFLTARNLLIGTLVIFGIVSALYFLFHIPVRFTLVGYLTIALSIVYLLVTGFLRRKWAYVGIASFLIGSLALANVTEYVFDNMLRPHQQNRIKATFGMIDDAKGVEYNVKQSVIAIGSGGFSGKGFLNGTQTKLKYVPEHDTDFIFCTVGEEHGFIGTMTVLALFLILLLRLLYLAERQRSPFSRIYGYCVVAILFYHFAINIGMVIGLTPVIGIPLPFFSYGGSSLWGFTILLFIFLRLDASRKEYLKT
jgi:rod shape determining protein RodA